MSEELAFAASNTLSKTFHDASDFDEQSLNPSILPLCARRMQYPDSISSNGLFSMRCGSWPRWTSDCYHGMIESGGDLGRPLFALVTTTLVNAHTV
jgi:hypothetical protein